MERDIVFTPNEYYHIYNRGINKHNIFLSGGDWKHFQRLLYIRNDANGTIRPERVKHEPLANIKIDKPLVNIQAYCLMQNHFHILMSEIEENGISTFMQKLGTSYSMYINKKYDRTGSLMCRPFRAKHVNNDSYMRWVISYIHLNPIQAILPNWEEQGIYKPATAQKYMRDYKYCSYTDYYHQERDEGVILNKKSLPFYISDLESIKNMFESFKALSFIPY